MRGGGGREGGTPEGGREGGWGEAAGQRRMGQGGGVGLFRPCRRHAVAEKGGGGGAGRGGPRAGRKLGGEWTRHQVMGMYQAGLVFLENSFLLCDRKFNNLNKNWADA